MNEENIKLKEYLAKINCKGCYNYCTLSNPICGRSKMFMDEAIEKFKAKNVTNL